MHYISRSGTFGKRTRINTMRYFTTVEDGDSESFDRKIRELIELGYVLLYQPSYSANKWGTFLVAHLALPE